MIPMVTRTDIKGVMIQKTVKGGIIAEGCNGTGIRTALTKTKRRSIIGARAGQKLISSTPGLFGPHGKSTKVNLEGGLGYGGSNPRGGSNNIPSFINNKPGIIEKAIEAAGMGKDQVIAKVKNQKKREELQWPCHSGGQAAMREAGQLHLKRKQKNPQGEHPWAGHKV